jgi:hypothetical protein
MYIIIAKKYVQTVTSHSQTPRQSCQTGLTQIFFKVPKYQFPRPRYLGLESDAMQDFWNPKVV